MTMGSLGRLYSDSSVTLETELTASEESLEGFDFASFTSAPVESWGYQRLKRLIDLFTSALLIALLALPALMIAAIIRCTSKGPVFYREDRIGRYGRVFRIWKFRSMYCNAQRQASLGKSSGLLEWRMRKQARDPRITPIGGFLRRWSLDEIPQLLNVLRGEMSLIGPRPIVAAEAAFYGELFYYYLAATPGLSGLWQVSGRSEIPYAQRAELDARYVVTWSPRTDFTILLRTIPAVLGRRGAY